MREIRDIHEPFIIWLREREIPYIYHRPDKKSGINKGHPDFTVMWCGRVIFIECKTEKGKLSKDQVERIAFLQKNGCRVEIARSVEACCETARCILTEPGRATDAHVSFPEHFPKLFQEMRETVAAVGLPPPPELPASGTRGTGGISGCSECGAENGSHFTGCFKLAEYAEQIKASRTPPANGKTFIGKLGNTDYVFAGSGEPGTLATPLRKATPADLINNLGTKH